MEQVNITDFNSKNIPTWCPGCGNFVIHTSLKKALTELNISPKQTYISFDIGCNGNGADRITTYGFKGLHGRAIPVAIGAHLANRKYTVFADIGDGGCLHEGLDHLIHAVRSNYDITILIHNNQNFALTTGQATATTQQGKEMYGLPDGKPEADLNIGELVMSASPTFFARGISSDPVQMTEVIKEAIQHKGCSVIEIMQVCPTYNPETSPKWLLDHSSKVETADNLEDARRMVNIEDGYKTGVIYQNNNRPAFYDKLQNRKDSTTELVDEVQNMDITKLLQQFE
jgi:2-oxoglutarate ferredoxin oxidoreductase subunit beta